MIGPFQSCFSKNNQIRLTYSCQNYSEMILVTEHKGMKKISFINI